MKTLFGCLFLLLAIACHNAETTKQELQNDTVKYIPQPEEKPKTIADDFVPVGDSLIIPPFEITVQLSETADKKLRTAKETIIVSAMFSGVPKDTTMKDYVEYGEFSLGGTTLEMPAPGTARFDNAKIAKKDFEKLDSKDIQILINVYSGRKSTDDNLLDCEILQEPISKVRQQNNVLKGKLIYE